jgi:hypothetical protein
VDQARQWAWARFYHPDVAQEKGNQPVLLKFVLDRHKLAKRTCISFVLGGTSRNDFWSLVQHCRQSCGTPIRDQKGPVYLSDGTCWYDVAVGPVAAFWRQKYTMHETDQISFHTVYGIELLNDAIKAGTGTCDIVYFLSD